jgi:flagellar FliJ protein
MHKFSFRLQKLLEYRSMQEEWAKAAYLEVHAARISAETELERLRNVRLEATHTPRQALDEMLNLENYLARIDDLLEEQISIIDILSDEEEKAKKEWLEAKRNHESLSKFRERAFEEWQREFAREEQKQLDDWSIRKRSA